MQATGESIGLESKQVFKVISVKYYCIILSDEYIEGTVGQFS